MSYPSFSDLKPTFLSPSYAERTTGDEAASWGSNSHPRKGVEAVDKTTSRDMISANNSPNGVFTNQLFDLFELKIGKKKKKVATPWAVPMLPKGMSCSRSFVKGPPSQMALSNKNHWFFALQKPDIYTCPMLKTNTK